MQILVTLFKTFLSLLVVYPSIRIYKNNHRLCNSLQHGSCERGGFLWLFYG